jgi:hypothetical protein
LRQIPEAQTKASRSLSHSRASYNAFLFRPLKFKNPILGAELVALVFMAQSRRGPAGSRRHAPGAPPRGSQWDERLRDKIALYMAFFARKDWAALWAFVLLAVGTVFGACIPWLTEEKARLLSAGWATAILVFLNLAAIGCYLVQQSELLTLDRVRATDDLDRDIATRFVLRQAQQALEQSGRRSSAEYLYISRVLRDDDVLQRRIQNAPDSIARRQLTMPPITRWELILTLVAAMRAALFKLDSTSGERAMRAAEQFRNTRPVVQPYQPEKPPAGPESNPRKD